MKKDKTTILAEKAANYICCFNKQCPRHEECLRWDAGQCLPGKERIFTCVNPNWEEIGNEGCPEYRSNELQRIPKGMKNLFYHDMPGHTERAIKNALIRQVSRTTYYKYHNGTKPIDAQFMSRIQNVCKRYGWTQPLKFDDEEYTYLW